MTNEEICDMNNCKAFQELGECEITDDDGYIIWRCKKFKPKDNIPLTAKVKEDVPEQSSSDRNSGTSIEEFEKDMLIIDSEELAKFMHDDYERCAKIIGWNTQDKCKVEFEDLPEENRLTMIAVACNVMQFFNEKGMNIIEQKEAKLEQAKADRERFLRIIDKVINKIEKHRGVFKRQHFIIKLEELKKQISEGRE